MRKTEILAYTAGIVDGEGYITLLNKLSARSFVAQVGVTNTNEWLCQWLKMQFGGTVSFNRPYKANWKPSFRWHLEHRKAVDFVKLIYPYLNLKKPQADIIARYYSRRKLGGHYNADETALNEAEKILIKKLNKRGVETE